MTCVHVCACVCVCVCLTSNDLSLAYGEGEVLATISRGIKLLAISESPFRGKAERERGVRQREGGVREREGVREGERGREGKGDMLCVLLS